MPLGGSMADVLVTRDARSLAAAQGELDRRPLRTCAPHGDVTSPPCAPVHSAEDPNTEEKMIGWIISQLYVEKTAL